MKTPELPETGFTVLGFKYKKINDLQGRLLTIAETLGLKDSQEKALKDLLREEVSKLWSHPNYIYNYENFDGEDKIIFSDKSVVVFRERGDGELEAN